MHRREALVALPALGCAVVAGCTGLGDDGRSTAASPLDPDEVFGPSSSVERTGGGPSWALTESDDVFATTIPNRAEFDRLDPAGHFSEVTAERVRSFVADTDFESVDLCFVARTVPDPDYDFRLQNRTVDDGIATLHTVTSHDPPERGETPAAAVLDGFFVRVQSSVPGLDGVAVVHGDETYRPVPAEAVG